MFIHVDLEAAKNNIGAAQVENIPAFREVLKSGWHFPIPIAFLIATLIWPEYFQIPIERAAVYSTAILIVLSLTFGYRGNRVTPRQMLRAILDTGRAALDIILIGAAAGMVVGSAEHLRHLVRPDVAAHRGERAEPVRAAAADRGHQHRARHGHADGERLCAYRDAAGALDRQARRLADGRAYVS